MDIDGACQQRRVWRPQHIENIEIAYRKSPSLNLPSHLHEELEMTIMHNSSWQFYYRGTQYTVPPGSFTLTQPGEVHKAFSETPVNCTFNGLRINATFVQDLATEIIGHSQGLPFFSTPIVTDRDLNQLIFSFHQLIENSKESVLKQESILLKLLETIILRYAKHCPKLKAIGDESQLVQQVRDYLNDNFAQNVSLQQLADITNFSRFYLNRAFRKQVGIPPHAYQIQIRIARAKNLLNSGLSISQVAIATGFANQSHFGKHFKRAIGVTPWQYIKESNCIQKRTIT
ncbi:AraC family transcriptional regulator [Mastigocoleus testarum]|nr:AraC family transcriptional regulator [Mastigocoleus testarum]